MDPSRMGIRPPNARSPPQSVSPEPHHSKHSFRLGMWQKINHLFGRDEHHDGHLHGPSGPAWSDSSDPVAKRDGSTKRPGVGLPRQATFKRQNSEKRERLLPVEPGLAERRAISSTRRVSGGHSSPRSQSSPAPFSPVRSSAPAVPTTCRVEEPSRASDDFPCPADPVTSSYDDAGSDEAEYRPPRPPSRTSSNDSRYDQLQPTDDKAQLNAELDSRWILNLSMHFRDKSDREKFFVTYAQTPTKWRRVTISCDYRNAQPGSLEMDLKELQFQREKSMQIYESIRDSLPEIQFYDSVTNLKLETSEGRLHVHVTEDINEIIPYPPRTSVAHVLDDDDYQPFEVRESDLSFDSHLSGFVYKVRHKGKAYIN